MQRLFVLAPQRLAPSKGGVLVFRRGADGGKDCGVALFRGVSLNVRVIRRVAEQRPVHRLERRQARVPPRAQVRVVPQQRLEDGARHGQSVVDGRLRNGLLARGRPGARRLRGARGCRFVCRRCHHMNRCEFGEEPFLRSTRTSRGVVQRPCANDRRHRHRRRDGGQLLAVVRLSRARGRAPHAARARLVDEGVAERVCASRPHDAVVKRVRRGSRLEPCGGCPALKGRAVEAAAELRRRLRRERVELCSLAARVERDGSQQVDGVALELGVWFVVGGD
mmetsp:Transcript_9480/g.31335  ORF Transcript_9480/g.31335 Transcript_9480/m.31335 type:complete len:279 (-) Transcript_9480:852-1688(-)